MTDNPPIHFPMLKQFPAGEQKPDQGFASREQKNLGLALRDSPLSVVLSMAGHSRACILGVRSGRSLACSCSVKPEPLDDTAAAVGMAIRFAQMAATRQVPVPRGVITALIDQVDAGNAAAILVWQWLARRGQLPAGTGRRPRLRIVCERS